MSTVTSGSTDSHKFVVYSFSGTKKKFQEWNIKALSLARVQKVQKYLTTVIQIPTESEADAAAEDSKTRKTYGRNVKAFDLLVRSCTGVPLGLVQSAEDGNAHLAWKALLKEYEISDDDVQELEEKWSKCTLDDMKKSPTEWWLKMAEINRQLESVGSKYKKDDIQMAGHILNNMSSG